MKAQVFLMKEYEELTYDVEKKKRYDELFNTLNIKKNEFNKIPFMWLNSTLIRIIEELCPSYCDYREFTVMPIPLEVLEAIAFAEKEKYFGEIRIYWNEENPDPFVVGLTPFYGIDNENGSFMIDYGYFRTREEAQKFINDNNLEGYKVYNYNYHSKKYLIARWGAEGLLNWEQLSEMAKRKFISIKKAEYEKQINELKAKMLNVENEAILKFNL